ncbi:MAG: hypothetical protein ND866_14155 [Pyrinomonadaceae bacterium]|nr:hypothetical protein [Pyrinomonadaceae bacterium]
MIKGRDTALSIVLLAICVLGCSKSSRQANPNSSNQPAKPVVPTVKTNADGTIPSGTGVEKEKPAPGKANVQGKAFFNEKPAENVEVKLCETFSRFGSGCGGETFTTRTDSQGQYLIKNVPPRIYEGLTVKVFNTNYYVFATSGIVQTAKYKIEPDQTFFAPDTNLFKNDLKLVSPKAGAKTDGNNIEVKWDSYPDAAYYKFSIYADTDTGAKPEYDFIKRRVDGLSFVLDKPLSPGTYTCAAEAYNGNDIKLAQNSGDIKFTVKGEATK